MIVFWPLDLIHGTVFLDSFSLSLSFHSVSLFPLCLSFSPSLSCCLGEARAVPGDRADRQASQQLVSQCLCDCVKLAKSQPGNGKEEERELFP